MAYSERAIAIPRHRLRAIVSVEHLGLRVGARRVGRLAALSVLQTAPSQVLHVDAVGLVEKLSVLALVVLGITLVAVDWSFIVGVVTATVAFALAAGVRGGAGEDCREVAAEEGSERGRAGADDAQLELDGGPYEEVEAYPAGVIGAAEFY